MGKSQGQLRSSSSNSSNSSPPPVIKKNTMIGKHKEDEEESPRKLRWTSRRHPQPPSFPSATPPPSPFVMIQVRKRPPKKELGLRPSKSEERKKWDADKIKERDELLDFYPEIPFKGDVKEIKRRHRDPSNPLRLPQHKILEPARKAGKKKRTSHGGPGIADDLEVPYWFKAYSLAQEKEGILLRHGRGKKATYHPPSVYPEDNLYQSLSESSDDYEIIRRSHKLRRKCKVNPPTTKKAETSESGISDEEEGTKKRPPPPPSRQSSSKKKSNPATPSLSSSFPSLNPNQFWDSLI